MDNAELREWARGEAERLRLLTQDPRATIDLADMSKGLEFLRTHAAGTVFEMRAKSAAGSMHDQAGKAAKDYLNLHAFSRAGLIEQLSSPYGDKFTYDQAVFGVNAAGL